ncbi:MAG: excinuclease ABC subunit UvrA [Candidatus Hermodarchaeota archaeon]
MRDSIEVIGARQNNLKNINVKIPRNKLTVVTGVSGSGKSSLAFDVIFGEGQRLFLESLSPYARSRVVQVRRPDVDFILGLSSVVSIQQHRGIRDLRSTVGTLTDISTYFRLLFSTMGEAYCPYCNTKVPTKSKNQIVEYILSLPQGAIVEFFAPVFKIYGESYRYVFDELRRKRIGSIRINGMLHDIGEKLELDEKQNYTLKAFIDKFEVNRDYRQQLLDIIKECQRIGEGFVLINITDAKNSKINITEYIKDFTCPKHQILMIELQSRHFSPNDSESCCLTCGGLGIYRKAVPFLIIDDETKSIRKEAINRGIFDIKQPFRYLVISSLAEHYNFSLDTPFKELPEDIKNIIFYGTQGERFELIQPKDRRHKFTNVGKKVAFEGLIPPIDRWYKNRTIKSRQARTYQEQLYFRGMIDIECPDCQGAKLLPQRLLVRINEKNIHELGEMSLSAVRAFIDQLSISEYRKEIVCPILEELKKRLDLLIEIGLGYVTLNRRADSISGGEIQRIRMSTQLGAGLMGLIYVLDEPSIGLHPRDNYRIINTLKKLRDIGNTIIVVEHDLEMIKTADHIIDMGPKSGELGGEVIAMGTPEQIMNVSRSLTGMYLAEKRQIQLPPQRRKSNGHTLKIVGASENNLKNITVEIPLGVLVCITGVSGSGKSTLLNQILYKALHWKFRNKRIIPGKHRKIEGTENLVDVRNIDQSPIGRSSRSNPATYVGFYDKIREVFAELPESKKREYTKSTFSYNTKNSGRCEECEGEGEITTILQFMPDVKTICPVCKGNRFKVDILEVKFSNLTISDVLNLSVEKAIDTFKDIPLIHHKLTIMKDLGLGYLKLGQSATTLSGGEAQRIKLAAELGKMKKQEKTLYIFDEPTTGLHLADIQKLLTCIDKLIEAGNSVIIIEHNLEIIKMADYIIDLGPDGGDDGGFIIAQGSPEQVAKIEQSYTGQYLRSLLKNSTLGGGKND